MKSIKRFNNFQINEKVGVAEPTLFYTEPMFNKVFYDFMEFYQSDKRKEKKMETINYSTIKPYIIDTDIYSKFPVIGIEIELDFNKMTVDEFDKSYRRIKKKRRPFAMGGYASGFGHRNWTGYTRLANPIKRVTDHGIILSCSIGIDISPLFDIQSYKKVFKDYLDGTIWHELNHLYDSYNRLLSHASPHKVSITHADYNRWGILKNIYDYWSWNFAFHLYDSEPHELNAVVQEVASMVSKYGFGILKKTEQWENAVKMSNFSSEEFLNGLDKVILENIKDADESTLSYVKNRLKKMWVSEYIKMLKFNGEEPTIPLNRIQQMDCDSFVEFFQKRINNAGETLKRRMGKLYSFEN